MKDVIVIAIVVAFFALCIGYVTWCERVVVAGSRDRHDPASVGSEAGDARRF